MTFDNYYRICAQLLRFSFLFCWLTLGPGQLKITAQILLAASSGANCIRRVVEAVKGACLGSECDCSFGIKLRATPTQTSSAQSAAGRVDLAVDLVIIIECDETTSI